MNKKGDSKVESNDSPEIPDRGEIRYPWPPFERVGWGELKETFRNRYIVERTNKAEIRPEEQSGKAESCRENYEMKYR